MADIYVEIPFAGSISGCTYALRDIISPTISVRGEIPAGNPPSADNASDSATFFSCSVMTMGPLKESGVQRTTEWFSDIAPQYATATENSNPNWNVYLRPVGIDSGTNLEKYEPYTNEPVSGILSFNASAEVGTNALGAEATGGGTVAYNNRPDGSGSGSFVTVSYIGGYSVIIPIN